MKILLLGAGLLAAGLIGVGLLATVPARAQRRGPPSKPLDRGPSLESDRARGTESEPIPVSWTEPEAIPAAAADAEATPPTGVDPETVPVAVPDPSPRAVSFYRGGNALWLFSNLWGLAVPAALLWTGASSRLRRFSSRIGRRRFFTIGIYYVLLSLVLFLLDLPLAYFAGYLRLHAYGLSNQTFAKWASDALVSLGLQCAVGFATLWVPYLLAERSPRRWWLATGLLTVPLLLFSLLIEPIWIDPLFNRFGPMKDLALEARILRLAHRAGIERGRVYEVEKSVDTRAINAYVTGFGSTQRIVIWDTAIRNLNERELLFVVGHEMGHYVLGHVWRGILLTSGLTLIALFTADRLAGRIVRRYRGRFGFDRLSDVASFPLFLLLVQGFSLAAAPLPLAYSRHIEHEADRFGLEITHSNHSAATAFVKMQRENLTIPFPGFWVKLWRASHPPLGERIEFCNTYRPWATGKPSKYEFLPE